MPPPIDDEAAANPLKVGPEVFIRAGIPTRFQPGHPGGPGRPKQRLVRAFLLSVLAEDNAKALRNLKRQIKLICEKGSPKHVLALLELIRDEVDGKLPVKADAEAGGGGRVTQFVYEDERPATADTGQSAVGATADGLADEHGVVYEPVDEPR